MHWEFLLDLLAKFGYGEKWCQWVKECISLVSMSILVNDSASREIALQKGLRQGDPLSPFIFNIVVEGLDVLLRELGSKN